MILKEINIKLVAEYFQFYLQDPKADENFTDDWPPEAVERMLAVEKSTVGVITVRDTDVPITLKLFSTAPELTERRQIDKINECDIEVISSKLVLAGCMDDVDTAKGIDLENGLYRLRIYYSDLHTLSANRKTGGDTYEIQLWKVTERTGLKIIFNRDAK